MSAAEPGRMIEPIPRKRKANQRQQPWLWTLQIIWNKCLRKRRRTLEFKEEAPSTWTDFLQTDPGPYTWVGNRIQKHIVCKWGWISSFNIMLQACRANVTNASDVVSDYYRLWFLPHTTGSRQFHVGAICKPPNSISNPKNDQQRGIPHTTKSNPKHHHPEKKTNSGTRVQQNLFLRDPASKQIEQHSTTPTSLNLEGKQLHDGKNERLKKTM